MAANVRSSHSNVNLQNSPEAIRRNNISNNINNLNSVENNNNNNNPLGRQEENRNSNRQPLSGAIQPPLNSNNINNNNNNVNPMAQSTNNLSINIGRLNNGDLNINYDRYFFDVMLNVLMTYIFGFGLVAMFVFSMTYFVILAMLWAFDIYNIFTLVMLFKHETKLAIIIIIFNRIKIENAFSIIFFNFFLSL